MSVIGTRMLLALAAVSAAVLVLQATLTAPAGESGAGPAEAAGWAMTSASHGDAPKVAEPPLAEASRATVGPVEATGPDDPGLIRSASLKVCIALSGATRRDHLQDHRLRRECAERVGVDLAALDR